MRNNLVQIMLDYYELKKKEKKDKYIISLHKDFLECSQKYNEKKCKDNIKKIIELNNINI